MTDVAGGQIGALVTSIFPEVGEPWFGTESNRIRYERVATSVIFLFSACDFAVYPLRQRNNEGRVLVETS